MIKENRALYARILIGQKITILSQEVHFSCQCERAGPK